MTTTTLDTTSYASSTGNATEYVSPQENPIDAIRLFEDKGFKVRVIMRAGIPWFVANDACDCLAIVNTSDALADLDDDDKLKLTKDELDTLVSNEGIKCSVDSRVQSLNLVSESGLYELIMQSRKPEAKAFKRWVTHEVLPSIRKTGGYGVQPREMTEEEILMQANAILTRRVAAITAEREAVRLALTAETAEHKHDNAVKNGKCGGITKNRNHYRTKANTLEVENAELKDAVGRGSNWRTVSMMKSEWVKEFGHAPVWQKLKQFSADVCIEPVKDVEEKVVLPDGREKVHLSYRYHREAWARYRKYEENLKVTDTEIENV